MFGEIGMDSYTYFTAFSRLAQKSIVFWGHAVTSGIIDRYYFQNFDNKTSDATSDFKSIYHDPQSALDHKRGGPDYFVSSVLFEDTRIGGLMYSQAKYSERLIVMKV